MVMYTKKGERCTYLLFTMIALLMSPLQNCRQNPQLSRDEAIAILISEVIDPNPHRDVLVAYGLQNLLHPGDTVAPFLDGSATTISADTWFFWVDNEPSYRFAHSANFVFIDASTGGVEVQDVEWWPVVNGTETWGSLTERLTTPDRVYGTPPIKPMPGK